MVWRNSGATSSNPARCSVRTTSWQVNSWRHWPLSGSATGGALVEGAAGLEVAPVGDVESFWPHAAARSASPIRQPRIRFMLVPFPSEFPIQGQRVVDAEALDT